MVITIGVVLAGKDVLVVTMIMGQLATVISSLGFLKAPIYLIQLQISLVELDVKMVIIKVELFAIEIVQKLEVKIVVSGHALLVVLLVPLESSQ